jgi:sirohydrochlorin ferrochelatase
MSGTRSIYPKAPATEAAVLLVAHGSRHPAAGAVAAHAAALAASGRCAEVAVAYLHGNPTVAAALARLSAAEVFVVPMLMSDGQLAQRIAASVQAGRRPEQSLHFCRPIGTLPGLAPIAARIAKRSCAGIGLDARHCRVLLVGHGNPRDPRPRLAAECLANGLGRTGGFAVVDTAFLEEAPGVVDRLKMNVMPTVVVGLFADHGLHAEADIPDLIAAASPAGRVVYAGPVGAEPAIATLILDEVEAGAATPPHAARRGVPATSFRPWPGPRPSW